MLNSQQTDTAADVSDNNDNVSAESLKNINTEESQN